MISEFAHFLSDYPSTALEKQTKNCYYHLFFIFDKVSSKIRISENTEYSKIIIHTPKVNINTFPSENNYILTLNVQPLVNLWKMKKKIFQAVLLYYFFYYSINSVQMHTFQLGSCSDMWIWVSFFKLYSYCSLKLPKTVIIFPFWKSKSYLLSMNWSN